MLHKRWLSSIVEEATLIFHLCNKVAPNYKKFDLHAVQVMGANIELWKYRLFKNSMFYLEEVFQKSVSAVAEVTVDGKNPVMVAAGKKAALSRATGIYTYEKHIEGKSPKVQHLSNAVKDFILNLDPSMEESPKKYYVAYKISQNIVCMEVHRQKVLLYLKLDPKRIGNLSIIGRDVSNIGHYGTGDLELSVASESDLSIAKPYIEMAYQKVGS